MYRIFFSRYHRILQVEQVKVPDVSIPRGEDQVRRLRRDHQVTLIREALLSLTNAALLVHGFPFKLGYLRIFFV